MSEVLHNVLHRFASGISTVKADDPMAAMPYVDPTKWAVHFDDFLEYDKSQGNAAWTLTVTNNVDTIVGPTGVVALTNAGADNDLGQLYHTDAAWQTNSKKMLFECRAKLDKGSGGVLTASEMFVGMSSVQTGANFFAADGLTRTMDDAIGFAKFDGKATMDCIQGEADVFSTETDAFTLVDGAFTLFTWYTDGSGTTKFYVDNTLKATLTSNIATSVLTPMFFVKGGEAKASVLSLDYFLVAAER
jgi:hypothetical protein|tara:strand:- start:6719 stop:7456 length:738 start_codon:yes stop_codon:yes gene_type:complete